MNTVEIKNRKLDVRDLPPPEPLQRALEEIKTLQKGEFLIMYHRREPCGLFPNLDPLGIDFQVTHVRQDFCEVLFWRKDDKLAKQGVDGYIKQSKGDVGV